MRNKGAIILVAVLLTLICVYYLSFTVRTYQIENRASKYAEAKYSGMKLKLDDLEKSHKLDSIKKHYLDSLTKSGESVLWMFKKYTYNEIKERQLNLGLDLKGGMNVTIEVSAADIVRALSNNRSDTVLNKALQIAVDKQVSSNESFVDIFAKAYKEVSKGKSLANIFITSGNAKISISSTDAQVITYLKEEYTAAIGNANEVLRKRIDHFGVVQPNIQEDFAVKGRFHIELPGIKDPERVRKLLQGTALLEFWETFENKEVYKSLEKIDEYLAKRGQPDTTNVEAATDTVQNTAPVPNQNVIAGDDVTETPDTNAAVKPATAANDKKESDKALAKSQHPLFVILNPSASKDGQLMEGPVVGRAVATDTAEINAIFRDEKVKAFLNKDLVLAWSFKPLENSDDVFELIALRRVKNGAVLNGDVITNAREDFGQTSAYAEVSMTMNADGSNEWARITRDNKERCIAIVLDGYVYSYPRVQNEIKGGRSSITGNFTINEAKDLANVLKSGKMPAPANILSEEIVGPSLGQKAIDSGLNSFIIAFIIVMLYMVVYYGRPGLTANLALLANLFFIFGVLASFGAVLTLPGIAGIVLTIGMAVDANILIFERIREEMRAGKALSLAVKDGYKNAYSAIIDGNLTTIIVAIILFNFGVGPIKGFATTLIIGILSSLFSAIFITRLVFDTKIKRNKKIIFETPISKNAFQNVKIKFIEKRKIAYVISGILIAISIISLVTRGLNPGIDFTGGRTYIVKFDNVVNPQEVAKNLKLTFTEAPVVKTFGAGSQVKITTKYLISSSDKTTDAKIDSLLYVGLKPMLPTNISQQEFLASYRQSSQKVGPAVAQDVLSKSFIAVLISLLGIFIYILFRFKKWQYSLGAVASLVHDSLIIIGAFSLFYSIAPFSMEVDQAFIAAILTVIGYSINDTVVVFDRIREYIREFPKRNLKETMNQAINSTLSRTMGTSLTTLLVLLAIFIFGGEVIRGFVFAILLGIFVGTYSSIFVATPIAYQFMKKKQKDAETK
ncbi:MAG: protein translocase subunit SecDF [Bacteroidales bacterium]|nr:protein translocase subunit SecDF [Bacteroidales bacterium]